MLLMAPLRILCFGDSLTWGLTEGFTQHAYASSLQSSLEASLSGQKVIPDNKGQNGDLVVSPPGEFLPRITTIYQENPSLYDWAVILGGTNDLGWGHKADEMYESIQKVWDIALSNGTKVLALTVPECGVKPMCSPELTARRDAYNAYILAHKQENLYTYDFHADIPWEKMPEKKRKKMWADGVHFTPQGYDFMGSRIAERIVEVISEIKRVDNGFTQDSAQKPIVAQKTVTAQKWWNLATSRFSKGKDPKIEVLGTSLRSGNVIVSEEEVYAAR